MNQQTAKHIAFNILKFLSPFGMKAGRYIYASTWRNQLIDMLSEGIEIDASLRQAVEQELKQAWQIIVQGEPATS